MKPVFKGLNNMKLKGVISIFAEFLVRGVNSISFMLVVWTVLNLLN